MKYEMVVARYKENIDWLKQLSNRENLKITVYNKFFDEGNLMPNEAGREAHTYLHHIYTNYDILADYTIFTQANPFDHAPDLIEKIKVMTFNNDEYDFRSFVNFFGLPSIWSDINGMPNHPGLDLRPGLKEIFPNCTQERFEFYPGAIIMASKKNIQKRSKEFYFKCLELSKNTTWREPSGNAACGYFFERTWKYILDSDLT